MKVTYFSYGIVDRKTENKSLFDIRPFIKAYCRLDAPAFKNNFKHNDEHIYLIPHLGDVFFFVMTRNNEVIRKIDSSDISISGIKELLGTDEHLGFASYVIIKGNYIGFASTIFAPKVDVFASFMDKLLDASGNGGLQFYLKPLMHQATKQEAHEFSHIGSTYIEIDKENSKLEEVLGVLGADIEDAVHLRSMQIVLRPAPQKDIKAVVSQVIDELPDDGLSKFMMRAKAEAGSQAMDLYITGMGAVSDTINTKDEDKIAEFLVKKTQSNVLVAKKLAEYIENEDFDEVVLDGVLQFGDVDAWADLVSSLQSDTEELA